MIIEQTILNQHTNKETTVSITLNEEEIEFFVDLGLTTAFNVLRAIPQSIADQIEKQINEQISEYEISPIRKENLN